MFYPGHSQWKQDTIRQYVGSFCKAIVVDMTQKSNFNCKLKLKLKLKVSWKFSDENISYIARRRVRTKCEYCSKSVSDYWTPALQVQWSLMEWFE